MPKTLDWRPVPPLPYPEGGEFHWLIYDTNARALWLLFKSDDGRDLALWRAPSGKPFELVASGKDLGLPYEPYFGFFFYDEQRKRPVFFGGTYSEKKPILAAWDRTRFAPIPAKDSAMYDSYDSAAYDPSRKVLLHFVNPDEPSSGTTKGRVRELHGDVWRDTMGAPMDIEAQARVTVGWDGARKKIVWVSPDDKTTFTWDGESWEKLGRFEAQSVYQDRLVTLEPATQQIAVLHLPERSDGPQDLWVLGKTKWEKRKGAAESKLLAGAHDRAAKKTIFFSEGAHLIQTWNGKTFTAGQARTSLADDADAVRVDAWIARDDGFVGVDNKGQILLRRKGKPIKTLQNSPPDYTRRFGAAAAWDPERSVVVVVSGKADKVKMEETWESDLRSPLARAKPTGRHPAEFNGLMAWHPELRAMILAGGVLDYDGTPTGKTSIYDGASWVSFPTDFKEKKDHASPKVLAFDERSGQLFMVRWRDYGAKCVLWIWGGEGKWKAAGEVVPLPATTKNRWGGVGVDVVFDAKARKLVAFGNLDDGSGGVGVREVAIGPWLDALPKPKVKLARAAVDKAVAAVAAKGKKGQAGKAAAKKVGKHAFAFKLGRTGDDQFGGLPAGIDATAWPVCAECNHPMPHVLSLKAHPERLPLSKHAGIALFCCDGAHSGGMCESYEPGGGANAAILLDHKAASRRALAAPPRGPKGAPVVMKPRALVYTKGFELDPVVENVEDAKLTNKVGGYPAWMQGAQTPGCPKCKKPMMFVAELSAELDRDLNFGDMGEGYLFMCPDEHAARFLWQCG